MIWLLALCRWYCLLFRFLSSNLRFVLKENWFPSLDLMHRREWRYLSLVAYNVSEDRSWESHCLSTMSILDGLVCSGNKLIPSCGSKLGVLSLLLRLTRNMCLQKYISSIISINLKPHKQLQERCQVSNAIMFWFLFEMVDIFNKK